MASANPIEEIKDRLGVVEVIGQRVQLKKAGRTFKGLCPFHNEKTPSFIVSPDRGTYHCFGCGEGGDIFTFVMKSENLDFPEALEQLAQRAGVTLKPKAASARDDDRREKIYALNTAAAQYYYSLLRSDAGRPGYDYLRRRDITDKTMESWQLGYASDAWDDLLRYLTSRGHDRAAIIEAGLAVERDSGVRDTFRGRVLFPIRDSRGNILGFGGRILGDGQPKYLNTPASPVFDKGACLFGIDVAKSAIRETGRAVLVEGYMDAITAHQAGINNVVGVLGTALTDRQVLMLKRLTTNLVLALDPDAAGEKAALKGLEVARQAFGEAVPVPQPGGLVRLEQRLDADLRIATMPDGLDPDEVIRRNPAEWNHLIESARPTVDFYFDTVLAKADLTSAKGVSDAAHELLPIVDEVRDEVQRSFYLSRLARELRTDEPSLRSELHRAKIKKSRKPAALVPRKTQPRVEPRPGRASAVLDDYYLELALQWFRQTGRAPTSLATAELGPDVMARTALTWLTSRTGAPSEDLTQLISEATDELPEPIADWIADRAATGSRGTVPLQDTQVVEELAKTAAEIRRRNLRWRSEELAEIMRQVGTGQDDDASSGENLIAVASALLAQLRTMETGSVRSGSWRSPSMFGALQPVQDATLPEAIERTLPQPAEGSQERTPAVEAFSGTDSDWTDDRELDESALA